jgi:hypothetical protein
MASLQSVQYTNEKANIKMQKFILHQMTTHMLENDHTEQSGIANLN